MIELLWNEINEEYDAMFYMSKLMAWLATALIEHHKMYALNGVIVLRDKNDKVASLLICDENLQENILQILQQPPGEYKGKYIAKIVDVNNIDIHTMNDENNDENPTDNNEET